MPRENYRPRLFATLRVTAFVSLTSWAAAQDLNRPRYPITETDITSVLRVIGINAAASQVHLPVRMSTAAAQPNLEIVSAQLSGENQVRLELRCASAECLPFLA